MKAIGGEPTTSSEEPRVATSRGLPKIIPGDLRLLIEAKDLVITRAVLSVLQCYRIMKAAPKRKLETITAPFKGLTETLPSFEVSAVVRDHFSRWLSPSSSFTGRFA